MFVKQQPQLPLRHQYLTLADTPTPSYIEFYL